MPRHLIPRERNAGCVNARRVESELATPPALPCAASASPLPNDSTAGTAGTV